MRLRRSELSTPGNNLHMVEKAVASAADVVFLDLEDSVVPAEKEKARVHVIKALNEFNWGKKTRAVRINGLETPWAYRDIVEVAEQAGNSLDLLIIPKVKSAVDILFVDKLLSQIEAHEHLQKRIGLEALIEEVEAMIHVEEIAVSSSRLEALAFGPADYSASQGVRLQATEGESFTYPGDIWHYARNKIIIACRAAHIDMIDGPYLSFHDPEGFKIEAIRAKVLGAVGKWAIHPNQITIANEVFSPTQEEVVKARKQLRAYEEAEAKGIGAVAVEGTMVDAASARLLRDIVLKSELISLHDQ